MKLNAKVLLYAVLLAITFTVFTGNSASASSKAVMWGNAELKIGQIGRVTTLKSGFSIFKVDKNGAMVPARYVKKGEVFRVYGIKEGRLADFYSLGGNLYAYAYSHKPDGSGIYYQKNLKYETPSKEKLALLR